MATDRRPAGRSERRAVGERKPREERWAELLEVATQVFYEKGYDGASLQDIANRLGMLKGSLYYYIQSKEDLLFEVISEVHQEGYAVVSGAASSDGDPLERLERTIRAHVEHTCRHLVPTAVFLHELESLPTARREAILGSGHAYQGVFRDLVAEAQRDGLVRADVDPRVAGLSILGSTNWVYRWFRSDGPSTPEEVATQLAAMAVHAVATPEALTARAAQPASGVPA